MACSAVWRLAAVWLLLSAGAASPAVAAEGEISKGVVDNSGVIVHTATSPRQSGSTLIRVLPPKKLQEGENCRVVYVLPVEAGEGSRYGDGLKEIQKLDLHNKLDVVFVAPTFSALPWYADHPTKPDVRQESYFVEIVVPFIEATYPVSKMPDDRLLLGFSKSGWGAWSLLLRHPDKFGVAAAWDAPLMMEKIGKYGNAPIFGDQENFQRYRISDLLRNCKTKLKDKRLILTGYGGFREHHQQAHELLKQIEIDHVYRDGPQRKHDWHSGWVEEAAELLVQPAGSP